jgi:HlyD family secretion protein
MKTRIGLVLTALLAGFASGDQFAVAPRQVVRAEAVRREAPPEESVRATGTVEPEEVIDVGTQVAGHVLEFGRDLDDPKKSIDYRSRVEEGTVLVRLDPARYKVAVEKARTGLELARSDVRFKAAQLQAAERDLERLGRLAAGRAVSHEEVEAGRTRAELSRLALDAAKAAVSHAEVLLKEAELDLDATTIRSPVKGVVIDRRVNPGQTVSPTSGPPSLFVIARDLRRLQVWASVGEADIGRVKPGQPARFTVETFPGRTFEGKVSQVRLNAATNKNAVTYTVVVSVDNANGTLLPYLTADVRVFTGAR